MDQYIAVDLEMTGLNPKLDRIIEIGAVKVENGLVTEEFETFVNPGRILEPRITELTGIRDEDLAGAPAIKGVIGSFIDFAGELPLVGHRIQGDYAFLKTAAVNSGFQFERTGMDTLRISRACLPELESKRLKDVCSFFGISVNAHRALNDAKATYELYEKLEDRFLKTYPDLFKPVSLVYKARKESPIRKQQKERLEQLIKRYGIDCPYDLDFLSRNEASRYYDQICSKYGKS